MPFFLRNREPGLREYMDDPGCDKAMLFATYRQFTWINRLFSGWRRLYRRDLRPRLAAADRPLKVLDIGCGGADILLALIQWAEDDGFAIQAVGIEPDERALEYVGQLELPANLEVREATSHDLTAEDASFDIVICNHLLHHLEQDELIALLEDAQRLTKDLVLFNDLARSDIAYAAFTVFAGLCFHDSFIVPDGQISLRRSYTAAELDDATPADWQVRRLFPYRLILSWEAPSRA